MKPIIAVLALSLSACAVFDAPQYDWFDSGKPKLSKVRWEKHPLKHIDAACGPFVTPINEDTLFAGCVKRLNNSGQPYCLVLSTLDEHEAKQVYDSTGMSHYTHEWEYHCVKALDHRPRK